MTNLDNQQGRDGKWVSENAKSFLPAVILAASVLVIVTLIGLFFHE